MSVCLFVCLLIIIDRLNTGGKCNCFRWVRPSVHPSVSTLSFEPTDLWPRSSARVCYYYGSQGIETVGDRSRSMLS